MPELSDLTPAKYEAMRERLDTRRAVARALGVDHETVRRRELGKAPITREAGLALRYLGRHGLPHHLKARAHRKPDPINVRWGTPGELREAFAILGWGSGKAAREILGPSASSAQRMSRMMSGSRSVTEDVARLVKRRLGLVLADAWPTRESRAFDNTAGVLAGLEAKE